MSTVKSLFCSLLIGLLSSVAHADDKHVFWEVTGKHNTVYLMGSVHLMQSGDRMLPAVTEAAYQDAENIVEELDILAVAAEMSAPAVLALQALPEGQTLAAVLGEELHARVQHEATSLQINMDFLERVQPWYVALVVTQARLARAGFTAEDGVDYQIALRARQDNKPLHGLEKAVDQLAVFAGMSIDAQRDFLRATLDEADVAQTVADITAVWRRGDLTGLEALLRSGAEESPEFFNALTTERNLRWMPQIEAMLADPQDDYLVVTGALHMVGEMGLIEQLRRKGYNVERK